ncbi:hypothetical protein B0T24DRAFT_539471 [Lasiosphaeria ovina]|uniref:SET domain-containing protein n=1 Tax=Lasiosphaeria ovina TaxID=92902 RepID=A0AAE0JT19_9PEZI|nr:hypothetical protein B0T24DRAFT_539471 [Lasiosphaeria ovina]
MDVKRATNDVDDNSDDGAEYDASVDDFVPSPREAFHTQPDLCKELLRKVKSSVPLAIRSSKISMGSGLFVDKDVEDGCEIYRSVPLISCINGNEEEFCHFCLNSPKMDKGAAETGPLKRCQGCKVARFCSKVSPEIRVCSLRKINAGEEITACYVDPTIDVSRRRALLKHEHFFDCFCTRCEDEDKENKAVLKGNGTLKTFHQAQTDMLNLMSSASKASKYPGLFPEFENLENVETQLRTIARRPFPVSHWPDHIEPLPLARLGIAELYLGQGKPVPALTIGLRGKLMSRRRCGPDWVNEMDEIFGMLVAVAALPANHRVWEDKSFPPAGDIRNLAYGYLYAASKEATKAFGKDCKYTRVMWDLVAGLVAGMPDPKPSTKELEEASKAAQARLMNWAGIPSAYGVDLSH